MEKAVSLANSAILNQAYRTLRDPIERVEYLLRLEAGSVKEILGKAPTDLFETLLEIQEQLDELQAHKTQQGQAPAELLNGLKGKRATLETKRASLERRLAELFHIWDRYVDTTSPSQSHKTEREQVLKEMRDILSQRSYLTTMLANIGQALA
jgi:molecular chaperone HscB